MATKRRTSSNQGGRPSKQGGGTFVGIVLGLIVGLAIAVIVALYITRSPTPFVAKLTGGAASDASAASDVDLNRSLQGKAPGQPVPGAAAPAAPAANIGSPEPQIIEVPPSAPATTATAPTVVPGSGGPVASPGEAPAPQAPQVQKPAPSANANVAALAPAPQPNAGANAAANDANSGYLLQVGAYKTEADADQQRARLAFQGFESKVTRRDASGVTYFRVRVGPFTKFADMNAARQRLSDAGIDTVVIRFQKEQ
ncbi:SPOR domain-containing protein [Pararobbsia alpina]|uniref:Cell division protein FtsN n=1 Tax=Pararobbsia alpina TaxID=621374 RepID=A0A6S7B5W9_9BURK|nr:SPOR domain-containing protein [Pararobbsia alpina]CAB3788861.1 Cell division protein FtsN [Pararobbsia alpina]